MKTVDEQSQPEDAPQATEPRAVRFARQLRESSETRETRPTVMVLAFEGWNDAGGAASSAVRSITTAADGELVERIDDEDYYDYQFTRPRVRRTGSHREIVWPSTKVYRARPESCELDLLLVSGVEPSFRWQAFTAEILTKAAEHGVSAIVLVGALLADVPHTRPIPAALSSEDSALQDALDVDEPTYEGPTGIVGVIAHTADQAGVPAVSLWAAVPHYVGQAPSPKAQLALMRQLEDLLGLTLEVEEVAEDAEAWERGVDELAQEDSDIAEYVQRLEEATDTPNLPEASGEAIAREFERYLRRRRPPERGED
ncbi:proteasome assembly chaperone family protein [Nesterenkonia suensis]